MPEINEAALKQQIAQEDFSPVYLIAGPEKYLVRRGARRLIEKAGGDSFPEFNRQEFTNESTVEGIADAAAALPFFAGRKCVALADYNVEEKDAAELEKLYALLEDLPESTVLVLWYPTLDFDPKRAAKWKKLTAAIQKRGSVLLCQRRDEADLEKLLVQEAKKAGCVLSRRNAARVLEAAGQDVTRLLGECEKLCAFALGSAGEDPPPEITAEMIDRLVPVTAETTVFRLADALTAGNYAQAYLLLDQLFDQKEEPVPILAALSNAYLNMYRVRAALESGRPHSAAAEYGDYAGKSFQLDRAKRSLRGMDAAALRKSLYLLLEADLALKGSRLEPRIVLDTLIARLLLAAKGERRG